MLTVPEAPRRWRWDSKEAQPLPSSDVPPMWYLSADAVVHATQQVKGTFPPPQSPSVLIHSLHAGAR